MIGIGGESMPCVYGRCRAEPDDVVNGGKRKPLVVQVAMHHDSATP